MIHQLLVKRNLNVSSIIRKRIIAKEIIYFSAIAMPEAGLNVKEANEQPPSQTDDGY